MLRQFHLSRHVDFSVESFSETRRSLCVWAKTDLRVMMVEQCLREDMGRTSGVQFQEGVGDYMRG